MQPTHIAQAFAPIYLEVLTKETNRALDKKYAVVDFINRARGVSRSRSLPWNPKFDMDRPQQSSLSKEQQAFWKKTFGLPNGWFMRNARYGAFGGRSLFDIETDDRGVACALD